MTLLEKAAEAFVVAYSADPHAIGAEKDALQAALTVLLTPTVAMVNRGGLKAFAGPQVEGQPLRVYPSLMWRAMLEYIINEGDQERDYGTDASGSEGEGEGGREPGVLPEHPDGGAGEPADGASAGLQGGEDGAEG